MRSKKTLALLLGLIAFFPPHPLHAEERSIKVYTNPISDLARVYNATVSIPAGEHWSLGPSAFYFSSRDNGFLFKIRGWGFGPRADYYFNHGPNEDSWYLGGALFLLRVQFGSMILAGAGYTLSFGLSGGYQWIWERFLLRLGLGYSLDAPLFDVRVGVRF